MSSLWSKRCLEHVREGLCLKWLSNKAWGQRASYPPWKTTGSTHKFVTVCDISDSNGDMGLLDFASQLCICTLLIAHCSRNNPFGSGLGDILICFQLPKDPAYGLSSSFALPSESAERGMAGKLSHPVLEDSGAGWGRHTGDSNAHWSARKGGRCL